MLTQTKLQTLFLYYYALSVLESLPPIRGLDPQLDETGGDITINEASGALFIQYGGHMANRMETYHGNMANAMDESGGNIANKRKILNENANGRCT